jgi:hypothetical protein
MRKNVPEPGLTQKRHYSKPNLTSLSADAALSRLRTDGDPRNPTTREMMLIAYEQLFGRSNLLTGPDMTLNEQLSETFQRLRLSRTRAERKTLVHKMMRFLEEADKRAAGFSNGRVRAAKSVRSRSRDV